MVNILGRRSLFSIIKFLIIEFFLHYSQDFYPVLCSPWKPWTFLNLILMPELLVANCKWKYRIRSLLVFIMLLFLHLKDQSKKKILNLFLVYLWILKEKYLKKKKETATTTVGEGRRSKNHYLFLYDCQVLLYKEMELELN